MDIRLKRAYDPPSPDDGLRILVERLWPRGLSKERAAVDLWLKDLAPSAPAAPLVLPRREQVAPSSGAGTAPSSASARTSSRTSAGSPARAP